MNLKPDFPSSRRRCCATACSPTSSSWGRSARGCAPPSTPWTLSEIKDSPLKRLPYQKIWTRENWKGQVFKSYLCQTISKGLQLRQKQASNGQCCLLYEIPCLISLVLSGVATFGRGRPGGSQPDVVPSSLLGEPHHQNGMKSKRSSRDHEQDFSLSPAQPSF